MRFYEVMTRSDVDRAAAEREARKKLPGDASTASLLAWYDRGKHTGGPLEPCAEEMDKCAYDYARTHGAEVRVSVNSGAYDFFYSVTPSDAVELDRKTALQVHEDIPVDELENQQGG